MKWSEISDRSAATKAIAEFDALGRSAFLEKYGFGQSTRLFVVSDGKRYDIKALAGATRGYADPTAGPAKATEFSSGKQVMDLFRRLGFQVQDLASADSVASAAELRRSLEEVLSGYIAAKTTKFGGGAPIAQALKRAERALQILVKDYPHIKVVSSAGKGNWAEVPWIALLDSRITNTTRRGIYGVYLFRADMTAVYATLNQGVTEARQQLGALAARAQLHATAESIRSQFGMRLSERYIAASGIDLRAQGDLGNDYEQGTIAWREYVAEGVPSEKELLDDLYLLLDVYDDYADGKDITPPPTVITTPREGTISAIVEALAAQSYTFEPWQVATFVQAIRSKPFVILAGISGTGKSRLPVLIGEATGALVETIPVRPDWTDSSDLIGYTSIQGVFNPGRLLAFAKKATDDPTRQYFVVLDEMNLARVEQYFAEVLSLMEDRVHDAHGGYASRLPLAASATAPWNAVGLPSNLAIVGTVNMDETTHGFSKKVLDRAFTMEMSEVELGIWRSSDNGSVVSASWPPSLWRSRALRPGALISATEAEIEAVETAIALLQDMNRLLSPAQLQVGYRTRDEIAMFLMNCQVQQENLVTRDGVAVSALDIAINTKILPRIHGGSTAVRGVLRQLVTWANDNTVARGDDDVAAIVDSWIDAERPHALTGARYPRTAARLCLMWERLQADGFTSYWL